MTDESAEPSDDILREIGKVAHNFSVLESVVAFAIWGLMGMGQRKGIHVTSGMPFKNLLGLFSRYALDFASGSEDKDLARDVRAFSKMATTASDKRNLILHSMWLPGENAGEAYRMKSSGKLPHFETYAASEIGSIAHEIRLCVNTLLPLVGRLPHIREGDL